MKMRLLPIIVSSLVLAPVALNAQSDAQTVFTSAGKMYVGARDGSTDDEKVTMNIQGSMLFVYPQTTTVDNDKGEVVMAENSRMALSGNLLSNFDASTATGKTKTGFDITGKASKQGTVVFKKTGKNETAYEPETRVFDHKTSDKVFYDGLISEPSLRLKSPRLIGDATTATNKQVALTIPNIEVAELEHVMLANYSTILLGDEKDLANAGTITIKPGGLFTVPSDYSTKTLDGSIGRVTKLGRLYFGKMDLQKGDLAVSGGTHEAVGSVLFDWNAFDRDNIDVVNGANSNKLSAGTQIGNLPGDRRRLMSFASPFAALGNDYMIYNTLTKPVNDHVGGGWEGTITDHTKILNPGEGYFVAQEVSKHDWAEISTNTSAPADMRAYAGYQFNRKYFLKERGAEYDHHSTIADAKAEAFTASTTEVKVSVVKGLNFLANPYLLPIDVSDLLHDNDEETLSNWGGISSGKKGTATLRNKIWLPYGGEIYPFKGNENNSVTFYTYKMKYGDVQKTGGIFGAGKVAPLQVFAVQASKSAVVSIPRKFVVAPATKWDQLPTVRAAFDADDEENEDRVDEILLQTQILKSDGEGLIEGTDRMSVVLRPNASISAYDPEDSFKEVLNSSMNMNTGLIENRKVKGMLDASSNTYEGLLYTQTPEGDALMTSVIPTTTKQIPVYFTAPNEEAQVKLTTERMETLQSVDKAYLIDHYLDNKVIELTPETEYVFTSVPVKSDIAQKNRFTLLFSDDYEDDDELLNTEEPIVCYYNSTTLYIDNLLEKDINSTVQIFDIQGRLFHQSKIKEIPYTTIFKPLSLGTYIVKITGERNYTTKFMVFPK